MTILTNASELSQALLAADDWREMLGHMVDFNAPGREEEADALGADFAGALKDGTLLAWGASISLARRELVLIAADGSKDFIRFNN